jgi:membrane protease YdiL (CAAX protease family)
VASIAFGVVVLGVSRFVIDDFASVSRRLTIGDGLTIALYAVVALLVRARLSDGDVRPDFAEGRDARAIGVGIATGLGGGIVIVAANSLIAGRLSSDVHLVGVLYERKWIHVAIAIVIAVIAAPLVEELLFRGLLVESLRSRGKGGAILGGAVAFSLWHLNPSALRYYVLMGFFLGLLYWTFGINGSITAHAVFNATLIVFAFAVVAGAPEPLSRGGVTVELPAGWFEVDDGAVEAELPLGAAVDVAVQSPTGSAFVVEHIDGQGALSLVGLGANLPPGATGARRVAIAQGEGLRFSLDNPGGEGEFDTVMTGRGNRVFIITFISVGSTQATVHHEQMLASLSLPA